MGKGCGILRVVLLAGAALLGACDGRSSPASNATAQNSASASPASAPPQHRWDYQEGSDYGYTAQLSEDQQKAGEAASQLQMFRYLGNEGGVYKLKMVSAGGLIATCTNPCQVIKIGSARISYNPDSVIGSAFQDAFDGQLVAAPAAAGQPRHRHHQRTASNCTRGVDGDGDAYTLCTTG